MNTTQNPNKPIDPDTHCAMDWGLAAFQLLAPSLFRLNRRATTISYALALTTVAINALTDNKHGLRRVISFREHGRLEEPFVPSIVILPWLFGLLSHRKERSYFLGFFVMAAMNFFLTDYGAAQPVAARVPARALTNRSAHEAATESVLSL